MQTLISDGSIGVESIFINICMILVGPVLIVLVVLVVPKVLLNMQKMRKGRKGKGLLQIYKMKHIYMNQKINDYPMTFVFLPYPLYDNVQQN